MDANKLVDRLRDAFNSCGSDKAARHGYEHVYARVIVPPKRILEVGVLSGASLRAWKKVWPEADVWGIDTFDRGGNIARCDGCHIIVGDSRDVALRETFDMIVDDGSHLPVDQADTFRNLSPLLEDGGVYFIEDVWPWDSMTRSEREHPWVVEHALAINPYAWDELMHALDGWHVFRHDLRANYAPDSYILEVVK